MQKLLRGIGLAVLATAATLPCGRAEEIDLDGQPWASGASEADHES